MGSHKCSHQRLAFWLDPVWVLILNVVHWFFFWCAYLHLSTLMYVYWFRRRSFEDFQATQFPSLLNRNQLLSLIQFESVYIHRVVISSLLLISAFLTSWIPCTSVRCSLIASDSSLNDASSSALCLSALRILTFSKSFNYDFAFQLRSDLFVETNRLICFM